MSPSTHSRGDLAAGEQVMERRARVDPSTDSGCQQIVEASNAATPAIKVQRHAVIELPFGRTCQWEITTAEGGSWGAVGTVVYKGDTMWVVTCNLGIDDRRARKACDEVLISWQSL